LQPFRSSSIKATGNPAILLLTLLKLPRPLLLPRPFLRLAIAFEAVVVAWLLLLMIVLLLLPESSKEEDTI